MNYIQALDKTSELAKELRLASKHFDNAAKKFKTLENELPNDVRQKLWECIEKRGGLPWHDRRDKVSKYLNPLYDSVIEFLKSNALKSIRGCHMDWED